MQTQAYPLPFFPPPLSLSWSFPPLLHFPACWILECHYDFCYQKQTAGQHWRALVIVPFFHAQSAVLTVPAVFLALSHKLTGVLEGQIYWQTSRCEAHLASVVIGDPPFPRPLYLQQSSSPPARVSMKMTSYLRLNLISFALWQAQAFEQCNWVNERHTLICCLFTQAAWGVTISASHTGYCMFDASLEGETLIMQSNFLQAKSCDV